MPGSSSRHSRSPVLQHSTPAPTLSLGLRANLPQFSLLVLVNAFVGAMVGIERSILPLIAEEEFGLASRSAILSFLVTFGIVKAISNLVAGNWSDRIGRKKLLLVGWIAGLPVPFVLMYAPTWDWIVAANVLLGINQGLCWSTTVIMKIDLAGPKQRGLAMGWNEFAGYLAVAAAAYWSASIAADFGLRPYPFVLGIGFSILGLALSFLFVRETHQFARAEAALPRSSDPQPHIPSAPAFRRIFALASWKHSNLFACSQAGMVNNLNDGLAWGLFPLFFASLNVPLESIGFLAGLYPATWGVVQVATGALSDRWGRKWMILAGMWVQAAALWFTSIVSTVPLQAVAMIGLGIGTAMVYPTLLAAVGDASQPEWRASAVGVYRLWRDVGYTVGAILSGIVADALGVRSAIVVVAGITFLSGALFGARYRDRS